MNELVEMKNLFDKYGVNKRLVFPFRAQDLWKHIGLIILEVTYGKKGHKPWI